MTSPSPREAARAYLRRGWAPIPVPFKTKRPVLKAWQRLRPTEADLPTFFPGGPQNVGVLLGEPSAGLADVDHDCPEALLLATRFLPPTPCAFGRPSAPRAHRFYAVDEPIATTRYRDPTRPEGDEREVLLELRFTGAQTLVPPSIHPSGEEIEWDDHGEPAPVPAADLRTAAGRLATAVLLARHWPATGSRHDAALALAGGLLHARWPPEEATGFVAAVALAAGDDELADRAHAATSTHHAMAADRRTTGWPTLARLIDSRVVDAAREWLGLRPAPGPTGGNAGNSRNSSYEGFGRRSPDPEAAARQILVPPFPLQVFPPLVRRFVEGGATAVGCPPDLLAAPFLGYAAAAIGRTRKLALKRRWVRKATLWTGVVAASGDGKSPADAYARAPLDILQGEADARFQEQQAAHKRALAHWKQADPNARGEEPAPPLYEHWYTTDPTVEALAPMLQHNAGIAAAFDELVAWARGCNAYKRGGNDRQRYLELWNGRSLKVDRKTQGVVYVADPVLCVVGGIQPERLPELTREASAHDGLLPRFLWTYPDVCPADWDWADAEVDELDDIVELFRVLRRSPSPQGPLVLLPEPEARGRWASWYDDNKRRRSELPPLAREVASKLPAQLVTLWLVLEALWAPVAADGVATAKRLDLAIELVEYFRAHARRVLAHFGTAAPHVDAGVAGRVRAILERAWVERSDRGGWLTKTEVWDALHRNAEAGALDLALGALVAAGVAESREESGGTNKRTLWRLRVANSSYEEFATASPAHLRRCFACGGGRFAPDGGCLACHPRLDAPSEAAL